MNKKNNISGIDHILELFDKREQYLQSTTQKSEKFPSDPRIAARAPNNIKNKEVVLQPLPNNESPNAKKEYEIPRIPRRKNSQDSSKDMNNLELETQQNQSMSPHIEDQFQQKVSKQKRMNHMAWIHLVNHLIIS